MPQYKYAPGMPKWLKEKPKESQKKLIREKSLEYIQRLAMEGKSIESATALIPDFVEIMGKTDSAVAKLKTQHIKTNTKFVDYIYQNLKNKITKVQKEI